LVFVLAFLSSGWFTYKVASASDKIFTQNTTGGSPILKKSGKKLKDQNGRINILLIGVGGADHDGGDLADTIQLVSISPKDKTVAMVSIPRDLYVQVPDSYNKVKINEVHSIGEENGTEGGGPALLKKSVSEVTGQPVHYFIRADFDGFKKVVDSVGGVDVNVAEPGLYDPYYPKGYGYQILNVRPGEQHMDGELALKYARSRETTSDFDRSRRQQEVMVAAKEKALSAQYLTNPAKISQLIDILGDHIKTDLSFGEAEKLAEIIRDIQTDKVQSKVIDGADSGLLYDSTGPGGAYILLPRDSSYSDIHQFVAQLFSSSNIKQEAPKVEVQNASGQTGLAAAEADLLTGYGFTVTGSNSAPAIAQKTVVYDYSNGKKNSSVQFLADRYKAQVVKQPGTRTDVDMQLVIGTDYAKQSAKSNSNSTGSSY
jgi:LCP family protein required for cell wall assembly